MSAIDIADLLQKTASIVRRGRNRNESVEMSDRGEVVAKLTPLNRRAPPSRHPRNPMSTAPTPSTRRSGPNWTASADA